MSGKSRIVDRITGGLGQQDPTWPGRWLSLPDFDTDGKRGPRFLLGDSAATTGVGSEGGSDDLEALDDLAPALLTDAGQSWLEVLDLRLFSSDEQDDFDLEDREHLLLDKIKHITRLTSRFRTRLSERDELMPVSRVKRPSRRSVRHLAAHTEDWSSRGISGVRPKRVLAMIRELDPDLYENRMVVELIHPVLTSAVARRLRRLRRAETDLGEIDPASSFGTPDRQRRIYQVWGQALDISDALKRLRTTIEVLESTSAALRDLQNSPLSVALSGRRTGMRSLRRTNVLRDDIHYRAAGEVWTAFERPVEEATPPNEREQHLADRHQAFCELVFAFLVRALDDLGFQPLDDVIGGDGVVKLESDRSWGPCEISRSGDFTYAIRAEGRTTRFVPLLDFLTAGTPTEMVEARWESIAGSALDSFDEVMIVYLSPNSVAEENADLISHAISSAGRDAVQGSGAAHAVAISPLEITSLERLSRAVVRAVFEPKLTSYPIHVVPQGQNLSSQMSAGFRESFVSDRGLSPLLSEIAAGGLGLRRPLGPTESDRLRQLAGDLLGSNSTYGGRSDARERVDEIIDAFHAAANDAEFTRVCPSCRTAANLNDIGREEDVFSTKCRACGVRWGLDRCGGCGYRIPVIQHPRGHDNPGVVGAGWVERVLGRDALASPCWSRREGSGFICPQCGGCPSEKASETSACARCQPTSN